MQNSSQKNSLTVVIIAKNEVDRIDKAIESVSFATCIVVLDSGSTDGTQEVCKRYGVKLIETDWPGFVAQKNRGLDIAISEWVLFLDADEIISSPLAMEIQNVIANDVLTQGYRMRRVNWWEERPLYFGVWGRGKPIRLVRKGSAIWKGRDPHDSLTVNGKVSVLNGIIEHHPYRNLSEHVATLDRYSRLAAEVALRDGVKCRPYDILFRAPWHFFVAIFFYMGWRDGYRGVCVAWLGGVYVQLKWWRIYQGQRR